MDRKYRSFSRNFIIVGMTLIFLVENRALGMVIVRDHQVSYNYKPGQP
jgi:hypothetical protein